MSRTVITIDGVDYEAIPTPGRPGFPTLRPLLLKSNGPERPVESGGVFIVYRQDEVMGWVAAMSAWQAIEMAFGHPHNPMYRAAAWEHVKHDIQAIALDEGRIEGRIWEGCPDCQSLISQLNEQIVKLTDELASRKSIEIIHIATPEMSHAR
jgi:hypothetical protein